VIGLVRFLHLLALGLWVGEIAFFSFVVAPAIFAALGPARAGDVVSGIFPRYYALGTAAAVIALGSSLVLGRRAASPGSWRGVTACVGVGLALTLWAAIVVHPRAQRLRVTLQAAGTVPSESDAFRRAHRDAVLLNAAALLAGLAGLGLSAAALRQ
jgi:uncharacterized membrane protein